MKLNSIVVYRDLLDKEPHKQVGVDKVMASGSRGSVMVNTLPTRLTRGGGSIPTLGAIVPIFITPL